MTTLTAAVDPWAHPLEPLHATVLSLAEGAPLLTLGAPDDQAAVWYPASWIADVSGPALPRLLDDTAIRWGVGRHGAAALAFKGYAWAATLPVVAGWALHRRVPLLESARLRIGLSERLPHVRLDLSAVRVAVLPDDPVAAHPNAVPVSHSATLLESVRATLVMGHLAEVVAALHDATRVGSRLLWGSVAEAVAAAMLYLPFGDAARSARHLLGALGAPLAQLVDVQGGPSGPVVRRRTCCLWFTGESGRGEYCSSCCVPR